MSELVLKGLELFADAGRRLRERDLRWHRDEFLERYDR